MFRNLTLTRLKSLVMANGNRLEKAAFWLALALALVLLLWLVLTIHL